MDHVSETALPLCEDLLGANAMTTDGKLQKHRKWIEMLNVCLSAADAPLPEIKLNHKFDSATGNVERQFGTTQMPAWWDASSTWLQRAASVKTMFAGSWCGVALMIAQTEFL